MVMQAHKNDHKTGNVQNNLNNQRKIITAHDLLKSCKIPQTHFQIQLPMWRLGAPTPHAVENVHITFDSPKRNY